MASLVGIDVAQATLAVAVRPSGEVWTVANDTVGHTALVERLRPMVPALIVLEGTGGREQSVAAALAAAALPVRIVNAQRVRAFARRVGRLVKTDPLDAAVLAQFAAVVRPQLRPLPDQATAELKALVTRRRQVVTTLVAEPQRRGRAVAVVQASRDRTIAALETEIAARIAADPAWVAKTAMLRSVPGVGAGTAALLLAALPELGTLTRQEVAALAGVALFNRDSGHRHGRATISGGRGTVRTALWMAMISAIRHNPVIQTFPARLTAQHKPPKVARIACLRTLLTLLNAMVRDGTTWNATHAA